MRDAKALHPFYSRILFQDIQEVMDALLAVCLGLGRAASGLVSCKPCGGVQWTRQNCLMLLWLADNLSESPSAAIKAEHGIQALRLVKIAPSVCSCFGKASSRGFG
jgi:hypothetical protein